MIMIVGFSGAFYILFTPDVTEAVIAEEIPLEFVDFQSTLLSTFLMILGSFDITTFKESTPHSEMAMAMFCLYQVLGMIVLLNLLIAIMGMHKHSKVMAVLMPIFRTSLNALTTFVQVLSLLYQELYHFLNSNMVSGDTFDRVKEMESLHFWKGR